MSQIRIIRMSVKASPATTEIVVCVRLLLRAFRQTKKSPSTLSRLVILARQSWLAGIAIRSRESAQGQQQFAELDGLPARQAAQAKAHEANDEHSVLQVREDPDLGANPTDEHQFQKQAQDAHQEEHPGGMRRVDSGFLGLGQ